MFFCVAGTIKQPVMLQTRPRQQHPGKKNIVTATAPKNRHIYRVSVFKQHADTRDSTIASIWRLVCDRIDLELRRLTREATDE